MYRTMLAIALLLTTGSQAYAPIQLVSDRGKGLVVLPQGFPGNIRGALMAPKLSVRSPASNDSPRSIPYFTARLDQTITWDDVDWCLEATGNKNGDAVRVNSCSGARAQKWNWIPDGRGHNMIQLSDTELCLHAIDKEVGPNGAPIKLRECGNEVAQWQFEESLPLPRTSQGDGIPYDARHVMIALLTLAGLGAVSLGARIWQVSATRNRKQESVCEVMALESMHPFRGAQAHASRTSNISMAEQKVLSGADTSGEQDKTISSLLPKQTWTKLLIVRHGESVWNKEGRIQGCSDIELNEDGRAQARELAQEFSRLGIAASVDAVVSSDLRRATETADVLARACPQALRRSDARLREIHFGDFQGKLKSELGDCFRSLTQSWKNGDLTKTAPNGESAAQVAARGLEGLRAAAQWGSVVVVVAHGTLLRWCAVHIELGEAVANPESFTLPELKQLLAMLAPNCSVSTVYYNHDEGTFARECWFEALVAKDARDDIG